MEKRLYSFTIVLYRICWSVMYFFATVSILLASIGYCSASKGKPPEVDETVQTNFKISAGTKPFKLSCPVKNHDLEDGIIIRWSKDEEEINSAEWGSTPYRLVNNDADLKIRNPRVTDSGHYRCMLINGFGHKKVEFTLEVYDSNTRRESTSESILLSAHESAPVWHDRNAIDAAMKRPLRLTPGRRLTLRCPARGSPLPEIYWSKNGERISQELTNPTSAKFVLDNVNPEDSGLYACRVENALGSLDADFRVLVSPLGTDLTDEEEEKEPEDNLGTLDDETDNETALGAGGTLVMGRAKNGSVGGLPQPVIDQPYNTTVRAGHTAQFLCKVQWRKDRPTMRWLRKIDNLSLLRTSAPNATVLHINDMHLLVLDQQQYGEQETLVNEPEEKNHRGEDGAKNGAGHAFLNRLLIPNVQRSDAGRYFCVVTNSAGQFAFRSAYLDVAEGRFPPFATSINAAIAAIIIVVLTLVTAAVVWLYHNGGGGVDDSKASMKHVAIDAPHQFSSMSSTSSSGSSSSTRSGSGKSTTAQRALSSGTAPVTATSTGLSADCADENTLACVYANAARPPPPPQIPLPPAPLNNTLTVNSSDVEQSAQYLMQQQQLATVAEQQYLLQQQQELLYLEQRQPKLPYCEQAALFGHDEDVGFNQAYSSPQLLYHEAYSNNRHVNSPLLGDAGYRKLASTEQFQQQRFRNGNMSVGELLYPPVDTVTLSRKFCGASGPAGSSQNTLHRTRAEDEMSRLSSHIYDILAANSPMPPTSPVPLRRQQQLQQQPQIQYQEQKPQQQQINDRNNNVSLQQQLQYPEHQYQQQLQYPEHQQTPRKYAPPPAPSILPYFAPPPPATVSYEAQQPSQLQYAQAMILNQKNFPHHSQIKCSQR